MLQQGQSYVEKQDDKTVKEWMRQQVRTVCVGGKVGIQDFGVSLALMSRYIFVEL